MKQTTKTSDMEHTGGKWIESIPHVIQGDEPKFKFILSSKTVGDVGEYHSNKEMGIDEAEANAKLIAEAGTVTNETGKTPRQLADLNKELLEALNNLYNAIGSCVDLTPDLLQKASLAIKKATL